MPGVGAAPSGSGACPAWSGMPSRPGLIQQPPANGARRRKQAATQTNMANVRAKMCAWCIVDENGARLFSDADVSGNLGPSPASSA